MTTTTTSTTSSWRHGGTADTVRRPTRDARRTGQPVRRDAGPDGREAVLHGPLQHGGDGAARGRLHRAGRRHRPRRRPRCTPARPFAAPFGIATSTDGKKLYVADPGADITLDANGNRSGGSDWASSSSPPDRRAGRRPSSRAARATTRAASRSARAGQLATSSTSRGATRRPARPASSSSPPRAATRPRRSPRALRSSIRAASPSAATAPSTWPTRLGAAGARSANIFQDRPRPGAAATFVGRPAPSASPPASRSRMDGKTLLVSALDPVAGDRRHPAVRRRHPDER